MWAGPLLLNLAGAAGALELEDANTEVVELEENEIEEVPGAGSENGEEDEEMVEGVEENEIEEGHGVGSENGEEDEELIEGVEVPLPELEIAITGPGEALVDLSGEALADFGGEALEGLGELRDPAPRRRGISVTWWEDSTAETLSEPDTYTEPTLDSEDGSLTSTRASDSVGTTGTTSRPSQRSSMRSFSVVVRGSRSPHSLLRGLAPHGFRGRSVTRRERRMPSAALRHRHPTHTPSRGPARRSPALAVQPVEVEPSALLRHHFGAPLAHVGFHRISRVREDQAEGAL